MWLFALLKDVNYVAVLAASVISFALAAIWYGPLFGKTWMNLCQLREEDLKDGAKPMVISFILNVMTALVMAVLVVRLNIDYWYNGIFLGLGLSLALYAFNIWSDFLFERRPMKLMCILSGYRILSAMIMGLVLVLW